MTARNIVEHISPGLGASPVFPTIDPFPLEQAKETFHRCVVGTASDHTHRADQVLALQDTTVFAT